MIKSGRRTLGEISRMRSLPKSFYWDRIRPITGMMCKPHQRSHENCVPGSQEDEIIDRKVSCKAGCAPSRKKNTDICVATGGIIPPFVWHGRTFTSCAGTSSLLAPGQL